MTEKFRHGYMYRELKRKGINTNKQGELLTMKNECKRI